MGDRPKVVADEESLEAVLLAVGASVDGLPLDPDTRGRSTSMPSSGSSVPRRSWWPSIFRTTDRCRFQTKRGLELDPRCRLPPARPTARPGVDLLAAQQLEELAYGADALVIGGV